MVYVRREAGALAHEPLQLMGATPDLDEYVDEMATFIEEHGAYLYPWSFGIRPTYKQRLERQGALTLNLYRNGHVTHICAVDLLYTADDKAGMPSPEPAFTDESDRVGPGDLARTWLRVTTWQDRTPLLGYYNPLSERYELPDFLAHVLRAAQEPDRPYVICLDEMNLAVVEHYFAECLSAWESGEAITLHDHPDKLADLPQRLPIPSNLMVLGTVNMDETTHGFSPKVLDWAFTVELAHVDVPRRCPGRMRLIG